MRLPAASRRNSYRWYVALTIEDPCVRLALGEGDVTAVGVQSGHVVQRLRIGAHELSMSLVHFGPGTDRPVHDATGLDAPELESDDSRCLDEGDGEPAGVGLMFWWGIVCQSEAVSIDRGHAYASPI